MKTVFFKSCHETSSNKLYQEEDPLMAFWFLTVGMKNLFGGKKMSRRLFTAAGYGMIAAFIIVLFSAFFLATLLRFTSLAESSLTLAPSIISLTALFIGGLISGMKMKEKGLVIGLLTGLSYCLLIMCIQFLGFDRTGDAVQYLLYTGNVAASTIGGVIGVNLFARRY